MPLQVLVAEFIILAGDPNLCALGTRQLVCAHGSEQMQTGFGLCTAMLEDTLARFLGDCGEPGIELGGPVCSASIPAFRATCSLPRNGLSDEPFFRCGR